MCQRKEGGEHTGRDVPVQKWYICRGVGDGRRPEGIHQCEMERSKAVLLKPSAVDRGKQLTTCS